MRFSLALTILSTAALAAASTIRVPLFRRQSFPTCADACLVAPADSNCSPEDDGCLCRDTAFINASTACIQASCSGKDLTQAEADAVGLCESVGVTITSGPSAPTSSSATSTPASSSSSSSTAESSSSSADITPTGAGDAIDSTPTGSTSSGTRTLPALSAIVAAALGAALAL